MRRRAAIYAAAVWVAAAVVLAPPLMKASAQSGRVKPTPTPPPAPVEQADARPKFVPDPNAERYRLIFPTSYERKFYLKGKKERPDHDATRRAFLEDFVARLNRAGGEGYRLLSAYNDSMAVVERGDTQYEYAWFETTGDYFFSKDGFEAQYARLSEQGFRLAYHSLVYQHCEYLDPENSAMGERCEYKDFFLLEREKGSENPREFRMARGMPRWHISRIAGQMTAAVREIMGQGFHPSALLSPFEVVLEKPDGGARPPDGRDVQIVRAVSFWGSDNLPKKVNELAAQGYRLELVGNQVAVMSRAGEGAAPTAYVWLEGESKKGKFEKELKKVQESGAVFRMVYPDSSGVESALIFERGPAAGAPREYRALMLEIKQAEEAPGSRVVNFDLTPPSKESWAELNRLAKEGFAIRALFQAGEPHALLERPK